ncbi:hypothetical protein BJF90_38925 [Pseudonocardia sp. CNS-004]|nr:hypothetical protein BJF90_38925 [Pseudonocardia sp. CNS-004]
MFTSGSTPPTGTRRRGSPWALVLAGLLAASACGTADPAGGEATTTLDASQPFGGDPATEGTPVAGGTLRVGMYTEARSFDPTIGSNLIASAVYDSLLKMDSAGEPQPFLAASMTSPDQAPPGSWACAPASPSTTAHRWTPRPCCSTSPGNATTPPRSATSTPSRSPRCARSTR